MAPLAPAPARALVFIGFMGAGKSTAAAETARALGAHARDSDQVLEERLGHTIAEEFESGGEAGFREREEAVVLELLRGAAPGDVLALGGGSVLSERVREALAPHLVVLLDIDTASAWKRVGQEAASRPLARDMAAFEALYAERKPVYDALADAILPALAPHAPVHSLASLSALSRGPEQARMLWGYSASGEYPAFVGRRLLSDADAARALRESLRQVVIGRGGATPRAFCVSDQTVAGLYASRLGEVAALIEIAPGEEHKTLASAERVWSELARAGMTRADHLLALGGGVVGDLAGFCAATYQRGVPIVQVPTTVVAQVDSAYGGKTGVDLPEAKNYVGAYHQPAAVLTDPDTLETLPEPELNAGWVEVLKTALIAGGELWRAVSDGRSLDERMIFECARTKLEVVAEDERDGGRRQVLNLGHTIGHAIEAATRYGGYRHGEAVGLGLLAALELSSQDPLRTSVRELLEARGLPVTVSGVSAEEILAASRLDKKRLDGALPPFVLVERPGAVHYGERVEEDAVRNAVERLIA